MGALATIPFMGPVGRALFVEGYGMVELGGGVATKVRAPLLDRLLPGDALGIPLPGWRFRVIGDDGRPVGAGEVGELHVSGPGVMRGYHGDAAATNAVVGDDGWVRTGDLVQPGPLGSVRFAGRAKDVIKRGGYSVYALEVQEALERHPAVAEAAVLGVPDPTLGEVPVAAVRAAPGASPEPSDVIAFAREHLAPYKVPVEVVVVDELPRTGSAKVQKHALRDRFTPRTPS
jgi:acyl-CoA synthetase (AMP-forming)/AMP-acid ligase II